MEEDQETEANLLANDGAKTVADISESQGFLVVDNGSEIKRNIEAIRHECRKQFQDLGQEIDLLWDVVKCALLALTPVVAALFVIIAGRILFPGFTRYQLPGVSLLLGAMASACILHNGSLFRMFNLLLATRNRRLNLRRALGNHWPLPPDTTPAPATSSHSLENAENAETTATTSSSSEEDQASVS